VPQLPQAVSPAERQDGPTDSPGQLLSGLGMPARGKGRLAGTVTPQYRPSGRAEDQEAGAVGAAGAWSVRPAAPAAAPGKMYIAIIAYDIVCIHRMHISPVSGDMRLRHRIIRTTSYNTDVTHAYRIRHRRKPTISYTTSYVTSYVRLARTVQKPSTS